MAIVVKHLRDEFARSVEPAQAVAREAIEAEHAVSDLVNAAYGLTPDEIDLMWATAPPRMPISRLSGGPGGEAASAGIGSRHDHARR